MSEVKFSVSRFRVASFSLGEHETVDLHKASPRLIQKYHDCAIVVRPCSAVVQRCQDKSLRRKDVLPKILARELG